MNNRISLLFVWIGQIISLFGSGLTGFALGVWLYQQTGSASNFALVALCTALPQFLLSPLAGVLVDRYRRIWLMALADSGSALCTLAVAVLFLSGSIQVWHIYLITALSAACGVVQGPAYSALVAGLIPNAQLGRANGMIKLGQGLAEILAPALAGLLVINIGVPGVLLIDLSTYLVAVSALLLARVAAAPPAAAVFPGKASIWQESLHGWQVLRESPGLFALLRFQALFSFLWNLFAVLVVPMVLGFASPGALGLALTVAGVGLLTGSLVMSVWGGPQRRLTGLLAFELASALAFLLMGFQPNLVLVAGAAFCAHFTLAFVSSLNETLWQSLTPSAAQGRVFAVKQAVEKAAVLLAYITAGALADRFLEPLMQPGGALAGSLGMVVGVGPGRGIAALFLLIGMVKALAAMRLSFSPLTRAVDDRIQVKTVDKHSYHC